MFLTVNTSHLLNSLHLFSRRCYATNNSMYAMPSCKNPRWNQVVFVGKYKDDEKVIDEELDNFRTKAKKAQSSKEFVGVCFETIEHCKTLKKDHPFHLPKQFAYFQEPSHAHEHLTEMFTMCFNKAKTQSDEETSMNNHSGYHYIGPCGAGKSFFLRVGCMLSSLLLPRFTGVYVDYASIPHSNLPVHIAAQLALNEKADNIHLEPANDMSSVLDIAQANKLSVGLFLDEAQNVYESQNWSNIHTLVTSFQNAAFITGSESKLSHLIGSSTPADLAVVNSLGLKLLQSLNDTKVCKRYFGGFTTLKQYYHYLDYFTPTRDAIFPNFPNTPVEKIPKSKFELEKIHIRFNGRLRGIQDPSQYKTDLPSLPRTPPEIEVMNLFKERIDAAGFDAFAPFPVPEREIQECIENKFKDEKINTAVLLHNLVETKLLLQVPAGYILYSPIVYVWLLNHTRSVFVSHAINNFEQIHDLVKKLLNPRSSNFIFSEDPNPSTAVAKIPIEKWETKQLAAQEDLSNKRILVVLTKEYCEKVDSEQPPNCQESDKPGCKREFL